MIFRSPFFPYLPFDSFFAFYLQLLAFGGSRTWDESAAPFSYLLLSVLFFFPFFSCGHNQYVIVDYPFHKRVCISSIFLFLVKPRAFSWISRVCVAFSVFENFEFCWITVIFCNGYDISVTDCACESVALGAQNHERLLKINLL